MSIQKDTLELQSLAIEIRRLSQQLSNLKKRKAECEKRILDFLEHTRQPGVKFNGQVILATEKNKRKYKKKVEKRTCGQNVLRKYGITNTEEALEELLEMMRGTPETVRTLKIERQK